MPEGIGKPLKLRLFLEGQEVPVISASINISPNSPATASVQVIPLDEGMDLKPRTMVHLFFLDQTSLLPEEVALAKQRGIPETEERLKYHLLFCGEVVGFAFGQTSSQRSLVLQCLDFSSYWDACHATAIEYGPNGNAFYNQSAIYGSNASLFDDIVNHQSEVISQWLRQKPKTPGLQNISGLAGGIIVMLEAMGGVPTKHKGINDFFTFAELRTRLLSQIVAEENDSSASRLFSGKVFDEWLRNGLQNIGQQVTFRDMLRLLCSYIYYDVVPNPAAKFDATIEGTETGTYSTTELSQNPNVKAAAASLSTLKNRCLSALDFDFANKTPLIRFSTQTSDELGGIVLKLNAIGSVAKTISSFVEQAQYVLQNLAADLSYQEPSVNDFKRSVNDSIISIQKALDAISSPDQPKVTFKTGTNSTSTSARLRSQIIRPDCFFAPAPRCNVIFPEHFTQVSFDRMYLSEVTRSLTMAYNTLIGRDQMFADKVMAPNIGLDMEKIEKQVGASGYRILMPHERHTGIIPRTEWLANTATFDKKTSPDGDKLRGARLSWLNRAALFHFFKYRFGPRKVAVAGKLNPFIVCGFPGVVILKPFMPKESVLRTALKVQESETVDSTDKKVLDLVQRNGTAESPLGAPYQLLGMIGSVSHTIDQNGGTTTVEMHHARRHLGSDDEFVGVFSENTGKKTRRIRVAITSDSALAQANASSRDSLLSVLVGITPQTTAQKKTKTVSTNSTSSQSYKFKSVNPAVPSTTKKKDRSQKSEKTETQTSDPVDPNGRIAGVQRTVSIPKGPGITITTGSKALFGASGTIVGIEVESSDLVTVKTGTYAGKQIFRSVIVHEDVNITVTQRVPVEEVIRPTWFSPKYANAKIGEEIYRPFFGTTSIIDELAFSGLAEQIVSASESPEGDVFDAKTKFEEIQSVLATRQDNISKLSIERAVNVVAYFYGTVRSQGKDIDQFVRSFTYRPIATMADIFGTSDLAISYDGKGVPTVTTGKPGFHSLSIDSKAIKQGNLAGLLQEPDKLLPRINNTGDKSPIPPVYDVRKEKLDQVEAYVEALSKGPGLRG